MLRLEGGKERKLLPILTVSGNCSVIKSLPRRGWRPNDVGDLAHVPFLIPCGPKAHVDAHARRFYAPPPVNGALPLGPHNTIFQDGHLIGFIDWDDASPGTRLRDLANAVYNYVDVSHWSNQGASEQARRILLMCVAYGWNDPLALVNDFEADVQRALCNHEQAGRAGAIKVFAEEVDWMRQRAQELRLALR